ncbi:MAG: hypothetical protein IT426_01610 [Pirellulales bacterium]|nr:hypothetical protein [Pirellulales bacterium]
MTLRQPLYAALFLAIALPAWGFAADGQDAQPAEQGTPSAEQAGEAHLFGDIVSRTDGNPTLLSRPTRYSQWDTRFGWWGIWTRGSQAMTGEYQDMRSSPFFDVDGFSSDGNRTVGVTVTGTDNESTHGNLYYYKNGLTAKIDYERFPHQLNHDPLSNLVDVSDPSVQGSQVAPKFVKQDLNVGQNYVLRVQEIDASFKKNLTDDLKIRLDVWGIKKDGTRQVNAVAKCYSQTATTPPPIPGHPPLTLVGGRRCHLLSQAQQVDWINTEVKPVVEWRLGDAINIEYSRPMRNFSQNDDVTPRYYSAVGNLTYNATLAPSAFPYSVVDENYTQMDQLKIGCDITEDTRAYSYLMVGETVNTTNRMERYFNNVDVRVTNTSIQNVSITGYGTVFNEDESMPSNTFITSINQASLTTAPNNSRPTLANINAFLIHPANYQRATGGLKGVWRPWGGGYSRNGVAIVGGYEYCNLAREYSVFPLYTGGSSTVPTGYIDESKTVTHSFQIGPDWRISERCDTFLRYKYQNADQPLVGVHPFSGAVNTLLPEKDNLVEVGFNWVPSDWLVFNATLGYENGEHHQAYGPNQFQKINYSEENYPISFNLWYAATDRFSLSAGYAIFSNFIDQDISTADQLRYPGQANSAAPVTGRWNYGGRAQVITLGSQYTATNCLIFTGQIEWVRGNDAVSGSSMTFPGNVVVTDLGTYSAVVNETTRLTVGMDWKITPRIVNYYRYELYDFNDISPGYQTGTAQGILGGLSAYF